jgi:hypothetical protein
MQMFPQQFPKGLKCQPYLLDFHQSQRQAFLWFYVTNCCDVEPVEGCTPLLALACLFAGDEANTSLSLEGFPSRRLPEPVKGVNFGSSSTATSEI